MTLEQIFDDDHFGLDGTPDIPILFYILAVFFVELASVLDTQQVIKYQPNQQQREVLKHKVSGVVFLFVNFFLHQFLISDRIYILVCYDNHFHLEIDNLSQAK